MQVNVGQGQGHPTTRPGPIGQLTNTSTNSPSLEAPPEVAAEGLLHHPGCRASTATVTGQDYSPCGRLR
jgi:hypothetical protein